MFKEIKKLHKQGYKRIVGIDEAGRGPLAGPVVAGAVFYNLSRFNLANFKKIKDSKKLTAKQREEWYKILTKHSDLEWGVASVGEKIIDKINILQATKLAMAKAVKDLEKKLGKPADFLIIDGNFILSYTDPRPRSKDTTRTGIVELPQKAIPKGDEKIFLCAAASIIAKVTRDRIMMKMHKKYPQYGFDRHKGYGTKAHLRALQKHGASKIHRRSFGPVRKITKN
ncbi:MAG: Ribonuclease HII [Parcubacteria group bacterium GW2011_GWF2_39_13b]|nr:MAG: Ribonuclease HII [Parcubacteria group bacterium GW2011_GWF2_39_13b]